MAIVVGDIHTSSERERQREGRMRTLVSLQERGKAESRRPPTAREGVKKKKKLTKNNKYYTVIRKRAFIIILLIQVQQNRKREHSLFPSCDESIRER